MLRIILSIICGLIIPVGYVVGFALVAVAVTAILKSPLPDSAVNPWIEMFVYGESAPGVLFIPVGIPEYIYLAAKAKQILPPEFFTDYTEGGFFITFNFILYGALTYWILGKLKRFKKHSASAADNLPPPPPSFEV